MSIIVGVVATALVTLIVATSMGSLNARTERVQAMNAAEESLRMAISGQETYAFDFALSRRSEASEELRGAQERQVNALAQLDQLAADDPEILAATQRIRELARHWQTEWLQPFVSDVAVSRYYDGAASVTASEALYLPLEQALGELATITEARQTTATAAGVESTRQLPVLLAPIGLVALSIFALTWLWVTRSVSGPLGRLISRAREVNAGVDLPFRPERDDEIGALALILERLRLDAAGRYTAARLEADRAATFNQLAELTSFAQDESDLVDAAVRTLARIAPTTRGQVLLLNNSTNRLIIAAGWGEGVATSGPTALDRTDRCPGIRRATAYVAQDLSDDLAVHCPAHPVATGSVVCLPMPALGTIVGVIHLERPEPFAFTTDTISIATRVAEQVALSIANARLMKTMEGLAMSDPLTGLRNPRFFDQFLEHELAEAERDGESTALLMLDVDHFKDFNDTHGHPAGDEALRALGRSLRSLVRSSDVVARYGGEEFIVALHRTTLAEGRLVAEVIRAGVEQMVVEIGPGRYARISVSMGVSGTDAHRSDARGLISLADAALYHAKQAGRNRVEVAPSSQAALGGAAQRRAGRTGRARPKVVEARAS